MKRILLIDHHDPRRDTRERLLLDAGHDVVTADPILALSENGLFLPKESLISVLRGGYPLELLAEVAKMLLESTHVTE